MTSARTGGVRRTWMTAALAFSAACSGVEETPTDSGTEPIDTGTPVDTGVIDSGTEADDAGFTDSGFV